MPLDPEVWQIDTNQAAHDFVAGIPWLHQLACTIKHITKGNTNGSIIDLWRHAFIARKTADG